VRCNVGADPCETVDKYDLTLVEITDEDRALIANAVAEISFPAWQEVCDAVNPSCSADWTARVMPALSQ